MLRQVVSDDMQCVHVLWQFSFISSSSSSRNDLVCVEFCLNSTFVILVVSTSSCWSVHRCTFFYVCRCCWYQVFGVVVVSTLYGVSAPLPAALAVLPRWSSMVVRAHCVIQAVSAVVSLVVFCLVATEPRSACRRLLCAAAADGPSSRRTSAGSINHVRSTAERPVVARLFHVEMTEDGAAATTATPTQPLDAECLLPQSTDDVTSPDNNVDTDVTERHMSPQGVERRLAFEHSNTTGFKVQPLPACQRTRLLATSSNFRDDVVFAHTSV